MEAITGSEWTTHPKEWVGAKKGKISKQNYFRVGGKESKVNFY